MRTSLRTTTAVLTSLAMVIPSVLPAQNTLADKVLACAQDPATCEESAKDALTGNNAEAETEAEAEAEADIEVDAQGNATANAEAEVDAEGNATAADAAAAEAERLAAEAERQAAEATAEAERQAAEATAEAERQAAEAAAAATGAQTNDATPPEAEAAIPATDEQQPADQAAAEAEADGAAAAEAELEAEAEAEADAQARAQAATEANANADAAADADAAAKDQRKADKAAQKAERKADRQAEKAAERATDEAARAQKRAERAARQAAEGNAMPSSMGPENLAAAAEAAEGDDSEGEMVEETVTEETARTSSEDFSGEIQAEAAPARKSGLSNFEKALLVGVGAAAVGSIIAGNRQVVSTAPDRLVVSGKDGNFEVLKDDNALLRQPGNQVQTRTFDDGSTRTVTTREDGSQVVTIRDPELRVVRRSLIRANGEEVLLIDDTRAAEPVDVSTLPQPAPRVESSNGDALRAALERQEAFSRRFTLAQVRQIREVRNLAPAIEVESIQFQTGSAAIQPEEARKLADLGLQITQMIEQNPGEIFLVEGHTDAVGSAATNLILSDRRAESLALALTEYFDVPPENLVVQGYGESDLLVPTDSAEPANRRAELRRITPLLQVAAAN